MTPRVAWGQRVKSSRDRRWAWTGALPAPGEVRLQPRFSLLALTIFLGRPVTQWSPTPPPGCRQSRENRNKS